MFVLGSKLKIGDVSFAGVHEVRIDKTIFSYVQTAIIKVPANMRLISRSGRKKTKIIDTHTAFKEGDVVTINLAYNDRYTQEFKGFVKYIDQGQPTEITCEGYSYQLRNNKVVNKYWKSTTVKEVLQEAIKDTDITIGHVIDMPLVNYNIYNATGAEIIDSLIKDVSRNTLTAFFIEPNVIWVGLRYNTPSNTVKFRFGYNIINDDKLRVRQTADTDIKFEFVHKKQDGKRVRNKAAERLGRVKKERSPYVADVQALAELALAKAEKENYEGLEGEFTAFLEPVIQPGDMALLSDSLYNRSGGYIVEAIKIRFGVGGARRITSIGLKVQ